MRSKLISLVLLTAIAVFVAGAWLVYFAHRPLELPSAPVEFDVKAGSSLTTVARNLSEAQLLPEPWSFIAVGRILGMAGHVKPGTYELTQGISPIQILLKITRGDAMLSEATFIEGSTFAQLRATLNEHPDLIHDIQVLSEAEILQRIGATESAAEGLFYPDTYTFSKGTSDLDVLKRSYRNMKKHLAAEWERRDLHVPYEKPYDALVVASIIEKETAVREERPLVAAVLINRLKQNMKLQTDPTVIYGLGAKYEGTLHKRDLIEDTPYNTYTRSGLPPTPIAMPGLASIQAALNPVSSSALYFVARGGGFHQFSDSLAEHNRAVEKYQK
jgi:peptidoglycan lytic transglycosylase G